MTLQIKNIVKVVEVGEVSMSGMLTDHYDKESGDDYGWKVGDHSLEDWLNKFQDRYVTVTIKLTGSRDESKLLGE